MGILANQIALPDGHTLIGSPSGNSSSASLPNLISSALAVTTVAMQSDSTATTQTLRDNTTKIATTAFVQNELVANTHVTTIIVKNNANTLLGEFSSISSAVNSIIDSSSTKPYVVRVSAGVYIEPIINLSVKTNISIIGSSIETTIIQPDADHDVISMGANCELSFLTIRNAPIGRSGVVVNDIGQFAQLHKISMFDNDTHIKVLSSTQDTLAYLEYVDLNGIFTTGLDIQATNGFKSEVNTENFYCFPTSGVVDNIKVDGLGASLTFLVGGLVGIGSDKGVLAKNQSIVGIFGVYFNGCQIAIQCQDSSYINLDSVNLDSSFYNLYMPNIGVNSIIKASGVHCGLNATYDLLISNSTADGSLQGNLDINKVSIPSSVVFPINFLDSFNHQSGATGSFLLGDSLGTLSDIKDLILAGAMGLLWGGGLSVGTGLSINVGSGEGYLELTGFPNQTHKKLIWNSQVLNLSANSDLYIYWDTNLNLVASSTHPDQINMILLGRVVTNASEVVFIDKIAVYSHHVANRNNEFLRDLFGSQFETGSLVSENVTTPFALDVSSGIYYYADNEFIPSGGVQITFNIYYRNGSGGWTVSANQTLVPNQYDNNSGALQTLASNEYTKHTLYLVGDGLTEKYFLVVGQAVYNSQTDTQNAGIPVAPTFFKEGVASIASIIVKDINVNIITVLDIRPSPLSSKSNSISITNHGDLSGLNSPIHHPWALDVNGSNKMLSSLDMNLFNIFNLGTVNGINFSSHASRHQHNGTDEIATVTAMGSAIPKADPSGTLGLGWLPIVSVAKGGTGATDKVTALENLSAMGYNNTYLSGLTETTNTSNVTFINQVLLTTPTIINTKNYRVDFAFNWRSTTSGTKIWVEILVDGTITKFMQMQAPAATSTDLYPAMGFVMTTLAGGATHTVTLRYRSVTNGNAVLMSNARVFIYGYQ